MHVDVLPVALPQDPGLSSEFHQWPLPGYLWAALERHTQSIFCTEPHLRIHGGLTAGHRSHQGPVAVSPERACSARAE